MLNNDIHSNFQNILKAWNNLRFIEFSTFEPVSGQIEVARTCQDYDQDSCQEWSSFSFKSRSVQTEVVPALMTSMKKVKPLFNAGGQKQVTARRTA